jgi:hypothetical protein
MNTGRLPLVNGLGCRQIKAQWSFDYLYDHSKRQEVSGGTKRTVARVIDGAVLVAAKLHSGRETDRRDVVAIADDLEELENGRHDEFAAVDQGLDAPLAEPLGPYSSRAQNNVSIDE